MIYNICKIALFLFLKIEIMQNSDKIPKFNIELKRIQLNYSEIYCILYVLLKIVIIIY